MSEKIDDFQFTPLRFEFTRHLSQQNCRWFSKELVLEKGMIVYAYAGHTYQCISKSGVAVTLEPDQKPFFEVPENAARLVL